MNDSTDSTGGTDEAKHWVLLLAATISAGACASTSNSNSGVISTPQSRTGSSTTAPTEPVVANDSRTGVVPDRARIDVRLQSTLSSETAAVEQRFEATTVVDLMQNGRVLIPAGSVVNWRREQRGEGRPCSTAPAS